MNDTVTNSIISHNDYDTTSIMKGVGVLTVDLNTPIIYKYGAVPQASCFGVKGCWSLHCPPAYVWLVNTTIIPDIRTLLL